MVVDRLVIMAAIVALGACGDDLRGPDLAVPDAYDWEMWLELDGVDAPYPTDVVLDRLRAARRDPHETILGLELDPDPSVVVEAAELLLDDGFHLRDNPVIDITQPIEWGENPRDDANWHSVLNSLVPLLEPLYGAFMVTGEDRYHRYADAVIRDWIDYNIDRDLPNEYKWYDMPAGKRAALIANDLDYQLRRAEPDVPTIYALVRAAKLHLDFLREPGVLRLNNHGLFVVKGLRALLFVLPEIRDAEAARAYTDTGIEQLVEQQFSSEFIHREHSPGYHLFGTQTFESFARLPFFGEDDAFGVTAELAKQHVHEMFHPNGDVVQIGDTGSAQIGVRAPAAILEFLMSDGEDGQAPPETDGYYPEVGYAIFRSPWTAKPFRQHSFLFFEAAFHSTTHKHADFFTFEWSERGIPIVVDGGKYAYGAGDMRKFFVSTRAGNTVEVDRTSYDIHLEQPLGSALTGWGRLDEGTRYVEASALREQIPVRHTRMLVFREGGWLAVIDTMSASETHEYRQWFGFHEDIDVVEDAGGFVATLPGDRGTAYLRQLDTASDDELVLERGVDQDGYRQGWISRQYLKYEPRYAAAFQRTGDEVTFVTLLSLDAPAESPVVVQGEDGLEVSFAVDSVPYAFRYWTADGRGHVAWNN